MRKLYPESVPDYFMEPRHHEFEVRDVAGMGLGLFTKRSFRKGQQLFIFSGVLMSKVTQHSLQITTGLHLHDPYIMGYSLHSCDPNCTVDMRERTFTALRDIEAGEPVTMNYNQTEDVLYKSFWCHCGSCDGIEIRGRRAGIETEQERITRLLTENDWHFAKTLAHIPHYYSRGREWNDLNDFAWSCDHIQRNSVKGRFHGTGKYEYNYFFLGKWKYWVMERDKPADQQVLINRAMADT